MILTGGLRLRGFKPVPPRYELGAATNWAMKPLRARKFLECYSFPIQEFEKLVKKYISIDLRVKTKAKKMILNGEL